MFDSTSELALSPLPQVQVQTAVLGLLGDRMAHHPATLEVLLPGEQVSVQKLSVSSGRTERQVGGGHKFKLIRVSCRFNSKILRYRRIRFNEGRRKLRCGFKL